MTAAVKDTTPCGDDDDSFSAASINTASGPPLPNELNHAYSGARTFLPWMLVISTVALPFSLLGPYRWAARMETAGFTDYPTLPWVHFQSAVFAAIMIGGAYTQLRMPAQSPPTSQRALQIFAMVVTTIMVLAWLGFASFFINMCPGKAAVAVLAPQRDAVANYNRGYCQAWCRWDPAALAALTRGDCGGTNDPQETNTVYDSIVAIDDVREWCTAAVALNDYALTAPHSGTSPFAGLKGKDGCSVGYDFVTLPAAMVNAMATLFLYEFSAAYWRMATAAQRRYTETLASDAKLV